MSSANISDWCSRSSTVLTYGQEIRSEGRQEMNKKLDTMKTQGVFLVQSDFISANDYQFGGSLFGKKWYLDYTYIFWAVVRILESLGNRETYCRIQIYTLTLSELLLS